MKYLTDWIYFRIGQVSLAYDAFEGDEHLAGQGGHVATTEKALCDLVTQTARAMVERYDPWWDDADTITGGQVSRYESTDNIGMNVEIRRADGRSGACLISSGTGGTIHNQTEYLPAEEYAVVWGMLTPLFEAGDAFLAQQLGDKPPRVNEKAIRGVKREQWKEKQ